MLTPQHPHQQQQQLQQHRLQQQEEEVGILELEGQGMQELMQEVQEMMQGVKMQRIQMQEPMVQMLEVLMQGLVAEVLVLLMVVVGNETPAQIRQQRLQPPQQQQFITSPTM